MKLLVRAILCCVLATGAWAQRGGGARGGGGHSGGFSSGGFRGGGGGFSHGFTGGGYHGGGYGGYHGGGYGHGYYGHGYYGGRFGIGLGFYGGYWPWYGYGYGWDPYWSYGYGYGYPYYDSSYYGAGYYGGGYASNPNVTVVYPQTQQVAPAVSQPIRPSIQEYRDEYGQSREITYLIAFRDGTIRASIAYWVDGNTLHYVTRDHQERTAQLDSVDRSFSEKLNRDQRVPFHLQ